MMPRSGAEINRVNIGSLLTDVNSIIFCRSANKRFHSIYSIFRLVSKSIRDCQILVSGD